MNKVYILIKSSDVPYRDRTIFGAITDKKVADIWLNSSSLKEVNAYVTCELDDPELLNRIVKEDKK